MIDLLTLEHIIPKKLGGKHSILTCKKCNNDIGSRYISKFIKNLSYADIDLGKSKEPFEAELIIEGKKVRVEFFPNVEPMTFVIKNKQSNPRNIEQILSLFKNGKFPEINLKYVHGKGSKYSRLSVLIFAYYILFAYFGYLFLFNASGSYLRKIILTEDTENSMCNQVNLSNYQVNNGKPSILIIKEPPIINNYALIQMPFQTLNNRLITGLVLPFLPTTNINLEIYKLIEKTQIKGYLLNFDQNLLLKPLFGIKYQLKFSNGETS